MKDGYQRMQTVGLETKTILQRTAAAAPRWAQAAEAAEINRRVSSTVAQDIREIGAHRLPPPACFGGAQATLRDHPLAVATAAEGCVAAGWCLAVWSAHNWMNSAPPRSIVCSKQAEALRWPRMNRCNVSGVMCTPFASTRS